MKSTNKIISIVAGLYFLWRAANTAIGMVTQIVQGTWIYLPTFFSALFYFAQSIYGFVILLIMGIFALRQKKRGKVLNVLGMIYIGYILVNILTSMRYGFSISALVNLAILVAAFVLTQKANGGVIFDTTDTKSEAAKVQAQAEKQTTIYEEQLNSGILTQEEYDQIINSRK